MQYLEMRALLALLTTVTLLPASSVVGRAADRHHRQRMRRHHLPQPRRHHLSHARRHAAPRLPDDYDAWSHVADCESGGWRVLGGAYPDSLGIDRTNFIAFGGTPLPAGPVSVADRIMQIRTADRLIAHYRVAIPDQYGCAAW